MASRRAAVYKGDLGRPIPHSKAGDHEEHEHRFRLLTDFLEINEWRTLWPPGGRLPIPDDAVGYAWARLALSLALIHVPGLAVAAKPGRKPTRHQPGVGMLASLFAYQNEAALVAVIDTMMREKGVTKERACALLASAAHKGKLPPFYRGLPSVSASRLKRDYLIWKRTQKALPAAPSRADT